MARPFGQSNNSGKEEGKKIAQNKKTGKEKDEKKTETLSECKKASTSEQLNPTITNVYHVTHSKHLSCGPTVINVINNRSKNWDFSATSTKEKCETNRKIKIRKGVLTSHRNINVNDIQLVAKDIEDDWKKLLRKLPGVTMNNFCFHQAFIDAMDQRDSINMAEIALSTWKSVLPEFSTIGNLSKALFNIGYPDIVTSLRP